MSGSPTGSVTTPKYRRAATAGLLVGALLAGTAACGGPGPAATPPGPVVAGEHEHEHGGDHDKPQALGPLALLFSAQGIDFDPAPTFADLAGRSTLVVTARLEEIREGRIRGTSREDPVRAETLIHVFTVVRALKGGQAGDRVFVETAKPGPQPARAYHDARPVGGEAVLYLVPRTDRPGAPVVDPRAGLDPGATPMRPTTPQGYLLVEQGTVFAPLAVRVPPASLFPDERGDVRDLRSWLPAELRGA